MLSRISVVLYCCAFYLCAVADGQTSGPASSQRAASAEGFRGIWYRHEAKVSDSEPPYSGGLATFSTQNRPLAVYAEKVGRTFFVYGGSSEAGQDKTQVLQICVSFYDHRSHRVARPAVLIERTPPDPHANPALTIDAKGYLWVFAPAVRAGERGDVFKSRRPFDISAFDRLSGMAFASPQPWYVEGKGLLLVFSQQRGDERQMCYSVSGDGETWNPARVLAASPGGFEAVSWCRRGKVGIALADRPKRGAQAANLYYLESSDFGQTWVTVHHEALTLPLKTEKSSALVFDYLSTGQSIWLNDLNFDALGNPTILYLASQGGAAGDRPPYRWTTARSTPRGWRIGGLLTSDHVCDSGSLYIENRSEWRLLAPTGAGPEPDSPGGEIACWLTDDFGRAWARTDLTHASDLNHNQVRRPLDAQPDFYALWADGAVRRPSASHLYFATREGKVFRLPERMTTETAEPELVWQPPPTSEPEKDFLNVPKK